MTTTQDAFHPMRGHVWDGQTVKCNNGDLLTIKSATVGFEVMKDQCRLYGPFLNAYALCDAIVQHGAPIPKAQL